MGCFGRKKGMNMAINSNGILRHKDKHNLVKIKGKRVR